MALNYPNNSMAAKYLRWTIKTSAGKVFGPYTKTIIFSLIQKGALAGTEQMAEYPGGEYVSISQSAEFYDQFLEAWESEIEPLSEERKVEELDRATQIDLESEEKKFGGDDPLTQVRISKKKIKEASKKSVEVEIDPSDESLDDVELENPDQRNYKDTQEGSSSFDPGINHEDAQSISFIDDVSLRANTNTWTNEEDSKYGKAVKEGSFNPGGEHESFSKQQMREKTQSGAAKPKKKEYVRVDDRTKKSKTYADPKFKILVVFIAVILAALLYDDHPAEKIRNAQKVQFKPIVLSKKIEKLSRKKWLAIKTDALKLMQQDTFSNYNEAMNLLVSSINKHGPDVESIGLLCTCYHEIWPYSEQNVKDLSAMSKATQLVSGRNIAGIATANCRSVQFLLAGNPKAAEQVLNSSLEQYPNVATFYDLKAHIMMIEGKKDLASAFWRKAVDLWPQWKKPHFWVANNQKSNGQYEDAQASYQLLFNQGDFHRLAAIEFAETEVFQNGDLSYAEELINQASNEKTLLPRKWRSKSFYVLSVIAASKGERDQAIVYAKRSYELDTKNNVARVYLTQLAGREVLSSLFRTERELVENGDLFFGQKNYVAAQAEFKAAFELNNENVRAGIKAAESLWNLNQGDEAIRWLGLVLQKNPKSVDAMLVLGEYLIERFRFTEAINHLKKAKSLAKNDYRVIRSYAHYEFKRMNLPAAKDYSEKAIRVYDSDIQSHIILSESLLLLGATDQAYKTIARAVSLEPLNVEAQATYAKVLASFQGATTGEKYILNLINTYPSIMEYRVALAKIYLMDNQIEKAKGVLIPITQVRSDYKPAFMNLAEAYYQEERATEALEAYLNAASLDPTDAEPLVRVGLIYQATNKAFEAITQYERAIKINSNYPRLYYYLGTAYLEAKRPKEALAQAMIERRNNPLIADSYLLAGDAYRDLGNYNKAIEEYRSAIQKRPQSAEIYVKLAICYRLIGNLDVAETMLATATAKQSGYAEIYRETGEILEKRNQNFEAVEAYRRYLGLKPNAKDADMVRRRIQQLE